jgi:SH3 domain protein
VKIQRSLQIKIVLLILLTAPVIATAEPAYITDKLVINVYSLQNEEGLVITSLNSGTPVEILTTDGAYTQIKTQDNKTGWLNNKYLSNEKPVTQEYTELQEKYKTTAHELEKAQIRLDRVAELERVSRNAGAAHDELEKRKKEINKLKKDLLARNKQLANAQETVSALKQEITSNQSNMTEKAAVAPDDDKLTEVAQSVQPDPSPEVDEGTFRVPFLWALFAMLFTAVIGFLLGMKWLDQRIRKRHGGVRFY